MKQPEPRTQFASKAPEFEHFLNVLCWFYAPRYPALGPRGEVADEIKCLLLEGRVVIDFHPDGRRLRIIPSAMNEVVGTA
jgi:hypothetical protein